MPIVSSSVAVSASSAVTRIAGIAGTFTYSLTAVPSTAPVGRIYSDPARTMLVYGPITTTNAGAPASWLMTYPSSIIAATYYLRFDSTLPGGALIDADDVLILVPVTGIVGASTIAPWTTPAALPCAT